MRYETINILPDDLLKKCGFESANRGWVLKRTAEFKQSKPIQIHALPYLNVYIDLHADIKRYKNGKPKDWFDRDWKAIIPYPFKWRAKLGKVECDCVEVVQAYQPWYGSTWYHSDECAIMKHYNKYPQMGNFIEGSPVVIAISE